MIKEALEYVNSLIAPNREQINGFEYSDKPLHRINEPHIKEALEIFNLEGVVDYINSDTDKLENPMIVVESPNIVRVFNGLRKSKVRPFTLLARAPHYDLNLYLDRKLDQEVFTGFIQTHFIQDENTAKLLHYTGNIESNESIKTGDDGVTQSATIKTSIVGREKVEFKNPIVLKPYRTFADIEQPDSPFILRLHEGNKVELKSTEDKTWEVAAIKAIKNYLKEAIGDKEITIIG